MGFAVYHMEKGGSTSGGMGNHIDRTEGKEHTYPHADPARKHLNIHFDIHEKKNKMPLHEAIEKRISEGYKGEKGIRKDAVKFLSHVLTGTHEDMKEIFSDKTKAKEWIQDNYKFLSKEFGKENIVRFTLHMDEKTPHLHAVTIPLTNDGRLSAKEIIGNKQAMKDFQTRYAAAMQKYGLERGIEATGIKHENAQSYYSRITEAEKQVESSPLKADKNVFGNFTTESVQNLEASLISANLTLKEKNNQLERNKKQLSFLSEGKKQAEKKQIVSRNRFLKSKEDYTKLKNVFDKIIIDPKKTLAVRELVIERMKKEQMEAAKKEQNKGRKI